VGAVAWAAVSAAANGALEFGCEGTGHVSEKGQDAEKGGPVLEASGRAVVGKQTYRSVADSILLAMGRPGPGYLAILGVAAALVVAAGATWAYQVATGMGVSVKNNPVGWAFYITSFVFWLSLAHSGTAISAILYLLRTRWRTSIFRLAEATTIFAVTTAGLFIFVHLGRLWRFYYTLPYPNQRDLWPNFKSSLAWDGIAITAYLTVSALFLYIGMIPDLAIVRDRSSGLKRLVYGALALGWLGSSREWRSLQKTYLLFAGIATPLVISVCSVVSWDFAVSIVPGWHSTIFAPYFVAGALHSGFAMLLTLLVPLRHVFGVADLITRRHLEQVCKAVIFTGLLVGYAYGTEFFAAWYSGNDVELDVFIYRATGDYAPIFWTMVIINAVIPLSFFVRRVRTNVAAILVISILINIGMWFERFVIIVTSLSHDYMPHAWGVIEIGWPDFVIVAGSLGWFLMLVLLFVRLMPWIAIAEVRETLAPYGDRGEGGEAR
jgi:molybdopterin-containing oxidoreductase family membrane subunit